MPNYAFLILGLIVGFIFGITIDHMHLLSHTALPQIYVAPY